MAMQNKKKPESSEAQRTFNIILSIVIALVLWAYVIGEVNPTTQQTITNVPVQLLNIQSLTARELAISGDSDYTVDVVVEGKRADIMKITAQDIIAEADLFGWSKGENFIPVNVTVPQALTLIEIKSAKIEVTIEDLVAQSKQVVVVYKGDMPNNTEEGAVEIKPSEIEVTGAKSEVETVTHVQVVIDITELSAEGQTVQGVAVPVNYAGMTVENVKLSSNYIDVFAKLYTLKEVTLITDFEGELAQGYGAEINVPKVILIKGSKSTLKDIDSVSAEPD
jgi:YbbR domain-containing protein